MNYSTAADASSAASTKPSGTTHAQVTIVVAGPGGTSILERLRTSTGSPRPRRAAYGPCRRSVSARARLCLAHRAVTAAADKHSDIPGLRYHPSGDEPRLYAGPCRGILSHAHVGNSKGPYDRHTPLVLTDEVIANFYSAPTLGTRRTSWARYDRSSRRKWRRSTTRVYWGDMGRGAPNFGTGASPPYGTALKRPRSLTNSASQRPTAGVETTSRAHIAGAPSPRPATDGTGCLAIHAKMPSRPRSRTSRAP
ncbi:hypothetical protein DL767_003458 [Monosporascus sp. MG133]|nr:hypothetical protein DL767_003458 [Monosporascus sp. MG133]